MTPPWPPDLVKVVLVHNKDGGGTRLFIDGEDWSHRAVRFTMKRSLENQGRTEILLELVADEVTYAQADNFALEEALAEVCEIRRELAGESDKARTSVPGSRTKVEN